MPNTCKSNGELLVIYYWLSLSGERVSNALVTCLEVWNNSGKLELYRMWSVDLETTY